MRKRKKRNNNLFIIVLLISLLALLGSIVTMVIFFFVAGGVKGENEPLTLGVRAATLMASIASFVSSTIFSLLIYWNNQINTRINDEANTRSEKDRNASFASANYSIIECMDRMLIYPESERYISDFIDDGDPNYHMLLNGVDEEDVIENPEKYLFVSLKIPFQVIEGKYVSRIAFEELRFTRGETKFRFFPAGDLEESNAYILYNELTQRRNLIINLIAPLEVEFFDPDKINNFSKIHIHLSITSLLNVRVKGAIDLFFTNPLQIEGNRTNTYRINSSNFDLIEMPEIVSGINK